MPLPVNVPDLFIELQAALAGRYSLSHELGRGGMGVVFLAREVDLDRLVAIKVLPPDVASTPTVRERFLREARTAARLSHPHIIPIYAVEQLGDFVFYVMGYVDGETLTQRVTTRGALPAGEGARILREVSWALNYAHAQGIVHRDIKPDNILLDHQSGRAIVADFGIASALGDVADVACGTPEFMSPEQALHATVDGRSDLYSLGATAFFAFSGRAPFAGATATETIARQVTEQSPPLLSVVPTLPRPLAQLVDRCLIKEPSQRPQSAQQVADALTSALDKRRELPAALRAFVKRDGRMDGAGTMMTLVGTLVGGVALSSVTSDVVGVLSMFGMLSTAIVTFGLSSARRLLAKGFRHADLSAAFQSEQDSLKEERTVSPRRVARVVERLLNRAVRVAASTLALLLPFCAASLVMPSLDAVPVLTILVTIATVLLTLVWLVSLQALRDVDVTFWRSVWTGEAGRLAFAAAKRLRGAAPTVAAMTHRATEMSLGLAAEQLYESLPKEVRQSLPDVLVVLEQLQQRAEIMRGRLSQVRATVAEVRPDNGSADILVQEEQRLAEQLRKAVGAMESLRLNLLRLHAGSMSVESVTMEIERVTEVADDVRRLAEARREVDDIFGAVHITQDLRTPSNPEYV